MRNRADTTVGDVNHQERQSADGIAGIGERRGKISGRDRSGSGLGAHPIARTAGQNSRRERHGSGMQGGVRELAEEVCRIGIGRRCCTVLADGIGATRCLRGYPSVALEDREVISNVAGSGAARNNVARGVTAPEGNEGISAAVVAIGIANAATIIERNTVVKVGIPAERLGGATRRVRSEDAGIMIARGDNEAEGGKTEVCGLKVGMAGAQPSRLACIRVDVACDNGVDAEFKSVTYRNVNCERATVYAAHIVTLGIAIGLPVRDIVDIVIENRKHGTMGSFRPQGGGDRHRQYRQRLKLLG